jgi:uncharacterized protein DUF4440
MKKIFSISILFLVCLLEGSAQKGIDGLIEAEKNFAAYSVAHSTKEAFLKFLDSTGIVFDNGKPVNGIETWNKREKRPGVLNWHPQYAEIARTGDFGYTTGPWTFQPGSLSDSIAARGQYTTVWSINKNGEWKFLVDLGVGNTPINSSTDVKKINNDKQLSGNGPVPHPGLLDAENDFLKLVPENKVKAYDKYLSEKSILNRNGYLPATASSDQKKLIELTPSAQYKMEEWEMSGILDMGYVYGTTIINGKTENYLRIWRWENREWKIALEVLRY